MKLILESKNAYGNGSSRWLVKNSLGEIVASVLRSGHAFAKYRLIRFGHPTTEFQNKSQLETAIQSL